MVRRRRWRPAVAPAPARRAPALRRAAAPPLQLAHSAGSAPPPLVSSAPPPQRLLGRWHRRRPRWYAPLEQLGAGLLGTLTVHLVAPRQLTQAICLRLRLLHTARLRLSPTHGFVQLRVPASSSTLKRWCGARAKS